MTAKLGIREGMVSAGVFGGLLFALSSVDPRVRDQFANLFAGGVHVGPWGARLGELLDALWAAARHQSVENAPLLVFATVGAVLTVFMLRT
jgi:hypothetical protein